MPKGREPPEGHGTKCVAVRSLSQCADVGTRGTLVLAVTAVVSCGTEKATGPLSVRTHITGVLDAPLYTTAVPLSRCSLHAPDVVVMSAAV